MDATWPKKSANSFWLAAARCFEQRRINPTQHQMLLIPGVVCLAFSIELGIKAMVLPTAQPPKIHSLAKLFVLLPENIQDQVVAHCGRPREAFNASLDSAAKTFEEWRYVYDLDNPSIDLGFLSALADAIKLAADAHAP
jgi:hypothetical protein